MSAKIALPTPGLIAKRQVVQIDYTNYRGERAVRRVLPMYPYVRWGNSIYHVEMQWLLCAFDMEKNEYREFSFTDIHSWSPDPTVI